MRHPLRMSSVHPQSPSDVCTAQEAELERYLAAGPSLRERAGEALQHTPWWTISLLVHLIALFILWLWPMDLGPKVEVIGPEWEVGIIERPTKERERKRKPPTPPRDPEVVPKDFKIVKEPKLDTPKYKEPLPPAPEFHAPKQVKPLVPPQTPRGLPIITVENHTKFVPIGPGTLKGRRKIRKWIGDGDTPGGDIGGGRPPEVGPIVAGLIWLAQAQERDGSWDAKRWGGTESYRVGMTGLAVLAYEGAGFTHKKGKFHSTIKRGLEWLARDQRSDGRFQWKTFYEQGIATMAVCEAFTLGDGDPRVRPMAQAAVNYICRIQPEHGGFRYNGAVAANEGDMSVTGWQIMALKSAQTAELTVPDEAMARCAKFLRSASRDYGTSAYLAGNQGAGSLGITAIGMLCRVFLPEQGDWEPDIHAAARYLYGKETAQLEPVAGGATKQLVRDLYYTYYSSLAMFQAGGEYWRAWKRMYRDPVIDAQVHRKLDARGRYIKGSWDPAKHQWSNRGGRVYATAMGVLCLEAPYRFLRVLRKRE